MSSKSKQAFARVPRKGKQAGAETGNQTKPKVVKIDAQWLSQLEEAKMNPDLSTVMTKLDANIMVSFNSQGLAGFDLRNKLGQVIADKGDIQKIQSLGSSITKERKEAQKENFSIELKSVLAAIVNYGPTIGMQVRTFPEGFISVYRSVNAQAAMLARNIEAIQSVIASDAGHLMVQNAMLEFGKRARIAIGRYIYHRATLSDGENAIKLNPFLRGEGVPFFIFEKLTKAAIATKEQGFTCVNLLWPLEPSKGFYLTFRELRHEELRESLLGLLDNADLLVAIGSDDGLLRQLINVSDEILLDNFDDERSFASKIASTPFFVPQRVDTIDQPGLFGFLAKNGLRGVSWGSGTVLSPQDNLKFVGTIARRMQYALLLRPLSKASLFGRMFPRFVFDISEGAEPDIFVQLKTWSLSPTKNTTWFTVCSTRKGINDAILRDLVDEVFADVVALPVAHEIVKQFRAACTLGEGFPVKHGDLTAETDALVGFKTLAQGYRVSGFDVDKVIAGKVKDSILTVRTGASSASAKQTTRAGLSERSMLSPQTQAVLNIVRRRGMSALALRMAAWFRGFLTMEVQQAVAELFGARLDAYIETPLLIDKAERLAFLEPNEDLVDVDEPDEPDPGSSAPPVNPDDA